MVKNSFEAFMQEARMTARLASFQAQIKTHLDLEIESTDNKMLRHLLNLECLLASLLPAKEEDLSR